MLVGRFDVVRFQAVSDWANNIIEWRDLPMSLLSIVVVCWTKLDNFVLLIWLFVEVASM